MNKNKLKLTFLLTATIIPITLATWLFGVYMESGVSSTTNKGVLVSPVLELTSLGLTDSKGNDAYQSFEALTQGVSPDDYNPRPWQLLFLGTENCDDVCAERLYFLRQIHTRLAGEASRVERVYVMVSSSANPDTLAAVEQEMSVQQPGLRVLQALEKPLHDVLERTLEHTADPAKQHYIYVADPLGNIMLYFTPENTPEEILSDLDKLLDHSSLG